MTSLASHRQRSNLLFVLLSRLAFFLCLTLVALLLFSILRYGIKAIDIEFLTRPASNFGAEGGIAYQIIGSVILMLGTACICMPIALGAAIGISEYIKRPLWVKAAKIMIYTLNAIPSILFGLFGLIVFVNFFGIGRAWFIGSIVLAMMILPTVMLASYQALNSVPQSYRDSGLALGLNKWQVVTRILLPQGFRGGITGLLLGLARAIGETAPIMFVATAFSGVGVPTSVYDSVSSLPTHILALAQQATQEAALQNAWGSSLVLICIVFISSAFAFIMRARMASYAH